MDELKSTGLCPICRCQIEGLVDGPTGTRQCTRCATWYHLDCWEYGGGCGVYGCEPSPTPRPCAPPPRPSGPFWERLVGAGTALALGMSVFLFGSLLGLLGWCVAGPLALPLILLVGWCSEARDRRAASSITFRRGVLFGPLVLVVLPFPLMLAATIPGGIALALAGYVLRVASFRPVSSALAALAVTATLVWSHGQDVRPVPFTRMWPVPRWAASNIEQGYAPYVLAGPDVAQAWIVGLHLDRTPRRAGLSPRCKMCELVENLVDQDALTKERKRELMAIAPEPYGCRAAPAIRHPERRLLVMPQGGTDLEVVLAGQTLEVRCGDSLVSQVLAVLFLSPVWHAQTRVERGGVAIALPPGPEEIDVVTRSTLATLLGPGLDRWLWPGGSSPRQVAHQTYATSAQLERKLGL